MAVTQAQDNGDGVVRFASGNYIDTGTAAAVTIACGFKPRYVKVVNVNASGDVMVEWIKGMADAAGMLTAIDGTRSLITTLGITVSASGFIIGLQTDLNVTSEQMHWVAWG